MHNIEAYYRLGTECLKIRDFREERKKVSLKLARKDRKDSNSTYKPHATWRDKSY